MTQPLDDKTRIEREARDKYPFSTQPYDIDGNKRAAYISGATKEAQRAQELIEALEKWGQAHKEFETGYRNIDGTMTRINIAQLSQACNEADKHLKEIFKNYKK